MENGRSELLRVVLPPRVKYSCRAVMVHPEGERVLQLQRSSLVERRKLIWECPGGAMEPEDGGYPICTLQREVPQETGLHVASIAHHLVRHTRPYEHPSSADDYEMYVVDYFLVGFVWGAVRVSAEHCASDWVSLPRVGELAKQRMIRLDSAKAIHAALFYFRSAQEEQTLFAPVPVVHQTKSTT